MVRLNIGSLKAEDASQTSPNEAVSLVESAVLSVDQVEMAPVAESAEDASDSSEAPSKLDLIESDDVKFGVDFYDNSLAHELGNEADVAELIIQSSSAEKAASSEEAAKTPSDEMGANPAARLSLISLASDISVAKDEKSQEKAKPAEEAVAFTPKIGKKADAPATVAKEVAAPEKTSEKVEDFFPNLIVGFEEEEKIEYVREVAKNLSEARKGGLVNLFGKNALVHTAIALVAIGGLAAASVFVAPKILWSIKWSGFEFKGFTSVDAPKTPVQPPAPTPRMPAPAPAPATPAVTPPVTQPSATPSVNIAPPVAVQNPPAISSGATATPPRVAQPPQNIWYTEGVDYQVVQGNKKNTSSSRK